MSWFHDNGIEAIDALPQMQSAIARRQQIYPSTNQTGVFPLLLLNMAVLSQKISDIL